MNDMGGRLDEVQAEPAPNWRETPLWRALEAMRIEPPGAALPFTARLAIENGWDAQFADAVYGEYLRFVYLSASVDAPLTPSDEVDQAWHLHLAYSRHYWDVLCGKILRRPFHHGPTAGGSAEAARHRSQYERTLASYRAAFGASPPQDIWPPAARRFRSRHVRVDRSLAWVLPKKHGRAAAALAAAGMATAACSAGGVGTVERFLVLMLLVAIGFAILMRFVVGRRRGGDGGSCGSYFGGDSGDGDGGGGCGGCGGD
jgi:hypothetical protein